MQGGLCSIHKHLGESHLSDLCFTYPRVSRTFNGQVEHVLTLSCPEAARQALLAEDAFEFIEDAVTLREATMIDVPTAPGMTVELMNDIRIFSLNLLRTRELLLWQRLAVLGTFTSALSRLCADGRQADIPALIEDIVRLLENGELLASLDAVQPNYGAQAMVFSLLWSSKGFESPSPYQQEVILVEAYTRGLARLDGVLKDAPYLLENYLANEMFLRLFPFETADAFDSYLRMVARFGLLRLLLAAQCNTDAPPSLQTLIATVHLHCRRFQHDNAYTTQVNQALQGSGWADLERLNSLIKV
jgi:lysine-N-methylase